MENKSDEKAVLHPSKLVVVYHELMFAFLVGWGLILVFAWAKSVDFIYLFYLSHPLVLLILYSFKWLQKKVASFSICFDHDQIMITSWNREVFDLKQGVEAVKLSQDTTFGIQTEEIIFYLAGGSICRIPLRAWGQDEKERAKFKQMVTENLAEIENVTRHVAL